jgi:translation initiation factor IF-2
MVARIAFAVALLPAIFAGLAVAGVKVPQVAQDAFEAVGVDLPNQGDSNTGSQGSDDGGRTLDPATPGDNVGKGAGLDKLNPAREQGRGNGAQGRGRALGKRGVAPGQTKDKENNAGGNGKGKGVGSDGTPPGQAKEKPTPPPQSNKPAAPPKKGGGSSNAGGGGNAQEQATGGGNAGGNGNGPVKKAVEAVTSLAG